MDLDKVLDAIDKIVTYVAGMATMYALVNGHIFEAAAITIFIVIGLSGHLDDDKNKTIKRMRGVKHGSINQARRIIIKRN